MRTCWPSVIPSSLPNRGPRVQPPSRFHSSCVSHRISRLRRSASRCSTHIFLDPAISKSISSAGFFWRSSPHAFGKVFWCSIPRNPKISNPTKSPERSSAWLASGCRISSRRGACAIHSHDNPSHSRSTSSDQLLSIKKPRTRNASWAHSHRENSTDIEPHDGSISISIRTDSS